MGRDALIASLRRVELFQGLSPLQITEIVRRAERIVFKIGAVIAKAGEEADSAYLLVDGVAEVEPDDPVSGAQSELIPVASMIGELGMLVEHQHGLTVVARSPVRCLKILRSELLAQMLEDPEVAERLTNNIIKRLTRVAEELRAIDSALDLAGSIEPAHLMLAPPDATLTIGPVVSVPQ